MAVALVRVPWTRAAPGLRTCHPGASPMDEPQLRERAESLCSALVAGDIDRVTEDFSEEASAQPRRGPGSLHAPVGHSHPRGGGACPRLGLHGDATDGRWWPGGGAGDPLEGARRTPYHHRGQPSGPDHRDGRASRRRARDRWSGACGTRLSGPPRSGARDRDRAPDRDDYGSHRGGNQTAIAWGGRDHLVRGRLAPLSVGYGKHDSQVAGARGASGCGT